MYFESRADAGQKLLPPLLKYRYENCIVVALSDGGVIVGEQIAAALHCVLTMMLVEDIAIPGENLSFGGVTQEGEFTYSSDLSQGQVDEYYGEFRGYLEEQKREKFQRINRLLGDGGILNRDMLRDHVVILVGDGMGSGAILDSAASFLKPIRIQRLVIAAPVVSVEAVDRMHIIADELDILNVTDNYFDADHYYTNNQVPSHEQTVKRINDMILNWQ